MLFILGIIVGVCLTMLLFDGILKEAKEIADDAKEIMSDDIDTNSPKFG